MQLAFDKTFFVDFYKRTFKDEIHQAKALDYGCGMGDIIHAARNDGYDFWGVDNFYEDFLQNYNEAHLDPMIKTYIKRFTEDGNCPYEDESFDFIYSNQVLEHIQDLDQAIDEMYRLLKPGGVMVHNFPCLQLIREAHFHIPCVHRIKNIKILKKYLSVCYDLGFGLHQDSKDKSTWITDTSEFLNTYCYYRPEHEILKSFSKYFKVQKISKEKKIYNVMNQSKLLRVGVKYFPKFLIEYFQKFTSSVTIQCIK